MPFCNEGVAVICAIGCHSTNRPNENHQKDLESKGYKVEITNKQSTEKSWIDLNLI